MDWASIIGTAIATVLGSAAIAFLGSGAKKEVLKTEQGTYFLRVSKFYYWFGIVSFLIGILCASCVSLHNTWNLSDSAPPRSILTLACNT